MNGLRLLLFVPLLAPPLYAADDDAIIPQPDERYAAMAQKSPFALATAAAPVSAAVPPFAANWYVAGIGKLGEEHYVTIKSRDATEVFSLYGKQDHEGASLASVDWSETLGKTKVVLRKGTEMATLEFSESEVKGAPGATPAAAGSPPNPSVPGPGATRAVGLPAFPANAARGPQAFPRGAKPGATPGAGQPVVTTPLQHTTPGMPTLPVPGQGVETRRRVMPIPAPMPAPPN